MIKNFMLKQIIKEILIGMFLKLINLKKIIDDENNYCSFIFYELKNSFLLEKNKKLFTQMLFNLHFI